MVLTHLTGEDTDSGKVSHLWTKSLVAELGVTPVYGDENHPHWGGLKWWTERINGVSNS